MTDEVWTQATDYEWHGRQLVRIRYMDCMADGTVSSSSDYISFTYNADGIRTSKNVSGVEHQYYLNGSQIVAETWEVNGTSHLLVYMYDETGMPVGLKHRYNTDRKDAFDCYFFEKNLQGDIIAIYNEEGTKIGSYLYDAWGNHTVQTASSNTAVEDLIVNIYNPFRYRGYYCDVETGWYYLQSRYYNPDWCRFINADGYISTGTGLLDCNMYSYCKNNPVMYVDHLGNERIYACAIMMFFPFVFGIEYIQEPDQSLVESETYEEHQAKEKYNSETLDINGSNPDVDVHIKVNSHSIRIIDSYEITDRHEQRAILEAILAEGVYEGSLDIDTMLIEWDGHNAFCYISKTKLGAKIVSKISNTSDPLERFRSVDILQKKDQFHFAYVVVTLGGKLSW